MLPAIEMYERLLRHRRADLLKVLDGLDAAALNWHPLSDETNSIYALAVHALGAERYRIHHQIGGRKSERDRAAEFRAVGDDAAALRAQYDLVAHESKEILERLTEEEMDVLHGEEPNRFTFRWCILHVIAHYAEHVGAMMLTRQLWENRTTRPHEI